MRPIERALEERPTPENEASRGYCLAVRASLTDDGRSPLDAPGLRLYERVTQISDSIARVQEKKVIPGFKAVTPAAEQRAPGDCRLWPPLQIASRQVRQAAQILANEPQHPGAQVRASYLAFVEQMQEQQADMGSLGETIEHFLSDYPQLRSWSLPVLRRRGLTVYQQCIRRVLRGGTRS